MFVDRDAVEGPNLVEIILIQNGAETSVDLPVEVIEKDIQEVIFEIGNVESDPTRIKPGDEFVKLDVTLQNLGDTTAKGVKAELEDLPDGVTFSESFSDSALLGNIEEDSTAVATYYLDVEDFVEPGEYTGQILATYKYKPEEDEDDFILQAVTIPIKLAVKPIPLYNITKVEFTPTVLSAGLKNVKMTLTLKNIGQEKGESVRIKVFGKSEQPFAYDVSSNFVAPSLEPGEEAQTTLEFDIDDDAVIQSHLLGIEIKNIVGNDVVTYDKKVIVNVSEAKKNNPFSLIIPIAVVIILVLLAIRFYRKRKRKNPSKIQHNYEKSALDQSTD